MLICTEASKRVEDVRLACTQDFLVYTFLYHLHGLDEMFAEPIRHTNMFFWSLQLGDTIRVVQ